MYSVPVAQTISNVLLLGWISTIFSLFALSFGFEFVVLEKRRKLELKFMTGYGHFALDTI